MMFGLGLLLLSCKLDGAKGCHLFRRSIQICALDLWRKKTWKRLLSNGIRCYVDWRVVQFSMSNISRFSGLGGLLADTVHWAIRLMQRIVFLWSRRNGLIGCKISSSTRSSLDLSCQPCGDIILRGISLTRKAC